MATSKPCSKCKEVKCLTEFPTNGSEKNGGLHSWCKSCKYSSTASWKNKNKEELKKYKKEYAAKKQFKLTSLQRKRHASKLQRTPAWLTPFDNLYIECLYSLAAMRSKHSGEKWHVDHVIPLQGKTVSGFHVPSNLRVVPAAYNLSKHNNYEIQ